MADTPRYCMLDTEKSISRWISDIRTKQKSTRNNLIYKLHLLGWGSPQIEPIVGIDGSTVRGIVENLPKVRNQLLEDFYNKPIEQIDGIQKI